MTDEKNINNSLKNQDKNFNKNSTHENNRIIIDGCNVGGCKYLNTFSDCDGYHYYCDLADDIKNEYCEYYKDCYFKQLARKTQECKALKSESFTREELIGIQENDIDRYRKALEEIEKQCKCYGRSKYTQEFDREYGGELDTNILDIITKAKDGNNE